MIKITPNLPYRSEQLNENNEKYKKTSIKRLIIIILGNWFCDSFYLFSLYHMLAFSPDAGLSIQEIVLPISTIFISSLMINLISFLY
ncbi:UNVERIFIED_CONTAM: hypothetical protein O8I53_07900 [Campylobacter lari]